MDVDNKLWIAFINQHRSLELYQPQSKSRPLHPRSTSQAIGRWHISRLKWGDPQDLSLCDLG
jgi:hypothetical protein